MVSTWKNIFSKKASGKNLRSTNPDVQMDLLLTDLEEKTRKHPLSYELNSKIKLFIKHSEEQKHQLLPGIFLEIENFLIQQKGYEKVSKSNFRYIIQEKYPALKKNPGFNLIFLDENIQQIVVSKLYLRDVLVKAKSLLGVFNDPFLIEAETLLENPYQDISTFTNIESSSILKDLFQYSQILQKKLKESLGENAMLNIYNGVFNKYFTSYYLLDSFTITVNLVPEELLIKENAHLPTKGQLHKLLKNQISSLEDINRKLSQEIQDRKVIRKKLEENENLYSAVLHNSLDANIIFKHTGEIIRTNKKANNLFEIEEGRETNLFELLSPQLSASLKDHINNLKLSELEKLEDTLYEFERELNADLKYYTLKLSPVFVDSGVVYFGVISDVTKARTSLKLVEEAKFIAEKSANAKSVFLSNMSHEIRTPLNAILGLSNLFTKENFQGDPKDFENIEGIRFSAENLLMIVDDILDFSTIEAGKLKIQKVDFNLRELLYNIRKGFETKAKNIGLDFKIELDPDIPKYVVGDQYRLSQILNNLLSNAFKFTLEGYVKFEVRLISHELDESIIQFKIEDSGCGISEKDSKHIFDSFYQTRNFKDNKPEGTGLGLAITKQLIKLLGSKLDFKSEKEVGSQFSFELTYTLSDLQFKEEAEKKDEKEVEKILYDKNILVAEDNKLNQLFIRKMLQTWKARVTIVNNGREALEILNKETFDLILMDIHMPVMDGLTATQEIRNLDSLKSSIPIVAFSADVFPESRQKAAEAGVNFYITKPVNKASFNEILYLFTK